MLGCADGDLGESAIQTALHEVWEETSLALEAEWLNDLGLYNYLPGKRLHLFALRVAMDAFADSDWGGQQWVETCPKRGPGSPR